VNSFDGDFSWCYYGLLDIALQDVLLNHINTSCGHLQYNRSTWAW